MPEELNTINNNPVDDEQLNHLKGTYANLVNAYGKDQLPDEQSFIKGMLSDKKYRINTYENLINVYGKDQMPTFDEFDKKVAPATIAGMRTSTATQPQPKQQKLSDFLPKYENRSRGDIASLPGAKALPQTDEQLQKHFEDQRQAYTNTAKSMLKAKNMPDTPQNVQKQENTLRKMAQNGDIALSRDDKDNPIYARVPSWQESFVNGLLGKVNQWQEAADQRKVIDDNKKLGALLEEQNNAPVPDFRIGLADLAKFVVNPSGAIQHAVENSQDGMKSTSPTVGGNLAHMIGGLTPYFAMGALSSTVPIATEAVFSGTGEKMKELYKQAKEQLLQQGYSEENAREKAAEMAKNDAGWAALPGAILNTALMGGSTNPIMAPAAKTFRDILSRVTLNSAKNGIYGAITEGATQAIQHAQGYDIKNAWDKIMDAAGQWGLTTLALEGLGQLPNMPGALRAAWKEYARQPELKPLVDEAINNLPNGPEIRKSLNDYESARQKVDGIVPDEHISSYAGILEKQDKIKDQINELESRKASVPEVLHTNIDEQIKDLQDQSKGLDKQLASFKKSANPLDEEIDDMTGQKLGKQDFKQNSTINIGDKVQWNSQGVDQFESPRKITSISEDGKYAFVEGTKTGIPIEQLSKVNSSRETVSDGNISKPIELNPEDTSQSPLNTEQNATTISEKQQQESNQQSGVSEHPGTESERNQTTQPEANNSHSGVGGEAQEVKGEKIVTASGLNEAERQALIEKRKRETKSTDKTIQTNELLEKIDKYDNLAKGRLGKSSSEGLKMLNEINLKARELGLKFDQKSSKLKRGRVSVKPDFTHEGNLSIDESGTVLRDRPIEVQQAFNDAIDNGAFIDLPTLKGDKRMSAAEIDGAIEDIHNGIPSVRANRYLDAFEKAYKEDRFPVSDNGREVGVPFNEFIGATKEHVGEPLSEQHINDWLNEQSKLTPDQDRILTDNIDNLIQEYGSEHQGEPTQKVEQSAATGQEPNSESAQPNNENIPTEANQTEPAPREPPNAKPIGAAARKLADKIREGKISKLGGFKTSTGFDAVWDGSLEVIAQALEKGADVADAIEQGLKYVRNTDWYKNLTDKKDFEAKYKEHFEEREPTSLKKEVYRKEYEAAGKELSATWGKDAEQIFKYISENIESGKISRKEINDMASDLSNGIVPDTKLNGAEVSAALLHEKITIGNEQAEVIKKLRQEPENADLVLEKASLDAKADNIEKAASFIRGDWSNLGRVFQLEADTDYSIAALKRKYLEASGEKTVPAEMQKKLEDYALLLKENSDKLSDVERQRDELLRDIQQMEEKNRKLEDEIIAINEKKQQRATGKPRRTVKDIDKDIDDTLSLLKKKWKNAGNDGTLTAVPFPYAKQLVEAAPILGKLAKLYIEKGARSLEEVIGKLKGEFEEVMPGISEREIRDALTGYGKIKKPSQNEVEKIYRDLKAQALLISKYEDATNPDTGFTPLKTNYQREEPSVKVKELRRQLDEAMKEHAVEAGRVAEKSDEEVFKTKLEAYKKRLTGMIDNVQSFLKGDQSQEEFLAKRKRTAIQLDADAYKLKVDYQLAKNNADNLIKRREMQNWPKWRKGLYFSSVAGKQALLLNISVLEKLYGSVAGRAITTAPKEIIGYAIGKAFPKLAGKAYTEGITTSKDLVDYISDYYSTLFSKRAYDYKKYFRQGASDAEIIHGGNKELSLLPQINKGDFIGAIKKGNAKDAIKIGLIYGLKFGELNQKLHGAIKNTAFYAEYEASKSLILKNLIRNGITAEQLKSPSLEFAAETLAVKRALRAKFQQDNAVVNLMHTFQKTQEAKGHYLVSYSTDALLPIVKIGSNYVAESLTKVPGVGLAPHSVSVVKWMAGQLNKLEEKQAANVLRVLKHQGIGMGLYALGWATYKNVMPHHASTAHHEAKKDKEVPDEGMVGIIPKGFTHLPDFESYKAGATHRWVWEKQDEEGKAANKYVDFFNPLAEGKMEATSHIIGESPFVSLGRQADRIINEGGDKQQQIGKFFGNFIFSRIPGASISRDLSKGKIPLLYDLGVRTGKEEEVDPGKFGIYPKSFFDEFRFNIPGLREDVIQERAKEMLNKKRTRRTAEEKIESMQTKREKREAFRKLSQQ